jgi:hypothetical protein
MYTNVDYDSERRLFLPDDVLMPQQATLPPKYKLSKYTYQGRCVLKLNFTYRHHKMR